MSEILIHDMEGNDGDLIFHGEALPISPETIEKMMIDAKIPRPYIAHSYSFRLNELNGQITSAQEIGKLNSLATMLAGLSEYERVKLEGAVLLTDAKTPEDCVRLIYNLDSFDLTPNVGDYESLGRYFAANDFADSLAAVPPDTMEHFDYELLGRMGWDDSTNVIIKGHHIKDMIAADRYLKDRTDNYFDLGDTDKQNFQKQKAFTGCELVHDTHRLALMNAMLHGIEGEILLADTLSNQGKQMSGYDVVLTNPPFGTKKGGERATRDDLTYLTSNKQLNFLQHIYRSLNRDGKARAAVVLPDNVLFADGDGAKIRADLMDKCNLHTILRLPTGIFYAQGVKTNVLFFTRGTTEKGNTKEVWFYDLRTNMQNFGKNTPLKHEHFNAFIEAYNAKDRTSITDERWNCFTRQQIADKADSLDLGLIRDDSVLDYDDLQDPAESGEEIAGQLEEAVDLIMSVVKELKSLGGGNDAQG